MCTYNGILFSFKKKGNSNIIKIEVFKENIRAIKCYEKCNFKLIADYDGKDTLGNPEIISVLLNTKNTNY